MSNKANKSNKDHENSQQQQILFSESDTVTEQGKTEFKGENVSTTFTEQVIFDNDAYLPMSLDENGLDEVRGTELNAEQLHHDGDMDHCGNMNNMDDCADGCDEYDMDMDFAD